MHFSKNLEINKRKTNIDKEKNLKVEQKVTLVNKKEKRKI